MVQGAWNWVALGNYAAAAIVVDGDSDFGSRRRCHVPCHPRVARASHSRDFGGPRLHRVSERRKRESVAGYRWPLAGDDRLSSRRLRGRKSNRAGNDGAADACSSSSNRRDTKKYAQAEVMRLSTAFELRVSSQVVE